MNEKGISVVICCYNSAGRITPTLEHLQRSSAGMNWEVIVVDNNSNDGTAKVAREIWEKNQVAPMKIVAETTPGLMQARMKGVSVSSYDIISFIDDDNWVDENWVANVYRIMENDPSLAACGGESIAVFESDPPQWFTRFQSSFAVGRQQESSGYVDERKGYLWGAGLSIRKSAWLELFNGSFISRLTGRKGSALTAGEDSEICLALMRRGWRLWYDTSLKLKHYIPASRLSEDYVKRMYKGFGKAEMILSVYRTYVAGNNKRPSWILQLSSALRQLFRSGIKVIFSSPKNRFPNSVMWQHDKAYALELLTNKSAFYDTINSISTKSKT